MIKIAIAGANGRMGKNLVKATLAEEKTELLGGFVRQDSSLLGADIGELCGMGRLDLTLTNNAEELIKNCDVLIDFTTTQASLNHLSLCQRHQTKLILGTTGFSDTELLQIQQASQHLPIVFAPNFSIGVNLVFKLLQQAAKIMGDYCDIEIIEAHHRFKIDAPSGTALAMGKVISETMGKSLSETAVYSRQGLIGQRSQQEIGFSTIRAGDIVGEHTVLFADLGERVEISHKATDRMTFAKGAVKAAVWLSDKQTGLYDMTDVLSLK